MHTIYHTLAQVSILSLVIYGSSWIISIICLFYLWRHPNHVLRKIIWSFILFIPILGPIFYGGFFKVPPTQPEHLRAANTIHRLGGPGI